jgi:hypothetical protein
VVAKPTKGLGERSRLCYGINYLTFVELRSGVESVLVDQNEQPGLRRAYPHAAYVDRVPGELATFVN